MQKILRMLVFAGLAVSPLRAGPLVVHEWGTFTVLQDENGQPIRGINTDDEPLPDFVHRADPIISTAKHLSAEATVTRVMIGRIELVTPEKRRLLEVLERLGTFRPNDPPAAYYLLGRFANALVSDEIRRRPSENLEKFAVSIGLAMMREGGVENSAVTDPGPAVPQ